MKNIINIILILILKQNCFLANDMGFEKLLGKHISQFEKSIGNDFENKLFQKNLYYIPDELVKKDFYGMKYNVISITTSKKKIVESISIHFNKIINRNFFDAFIEKYGKPNKIQIVANSRIVSEGKYKDGDFSSNLRKREIELKDGTFEENPLYIFWEKETYEIKSFLRHEQNMSEIIFSIK